MKNKIKGLLKDIDEAMIEGHSEWATGVYYALLELGLDDEDFKKILCNPEACLFYKSKTHKKITNGEIAKMLFPEEITDKLFLNLVNFWEMPYKEKTDK